MDKIKNYLKNLFTGLNCLVTVLFAFLAFTVVVANYEFGIVGTILQRPRILAFMLIVAVIFVAIFVYYMWKSLKSHKITLADSIACALVLIGVIGLVYFLIAFGLNIRRAIAVILAIVLGCVYIGLRLYAVAQDEPEVTYGNKSIKGYYAKIVEKYPVPVLAVLAVIGMCGAFLFLAAGYVKSVLGNNIVETLLVALLFALPILAWAVKSALAKNVGVIDAILVVAIPVIVVALAQILLSSFSTKKIIAWAIVVAIYLIVLLVRFAKFDLSASECCCNKARNSRNYLDAVFSRYSVLDVLALVGVLSLMVLAVYKPYALQTSIRYILKGWITFRMLPVFVLTAVVLVVIAICAFGSLLCIKCKNVSIGDFMLVVCISFVFACVLNAIVYPSTALLIATLALAVYCAVIAIVRIKVLSAK